MENINEPKQNLFTWKENATRCCSGGNVEATERTNSLAVKKRIAKYGKKQKRTRWFCKAIDTIGTILSVVFTFAFWGIILLIVLLL